MKKALNFLVLSTLIFSFSLLSAATVNFPIDQPVTQNIKDWSRKVKANGPLNYNEMQTILTLKEINTPLWNLEAFYLKGWLGKKAAPEEVSLISVAPSTYPYRPPSHISTSVIGTIGDFPLSLTYGTNSTLDYHLAALWYIHELELAVGDTFIIAVMFGYGWAKYEILGINDKTVDYSIEIVGTFVTIRGKGFWDRKNGLVGQFSAYGIDKHEQRFEFSSFPQ